MCLFSCDRVSQQEGGEGQRLGDAFTALQDPGVSEQDDRPGGTCHPEVRVGLRLRVELRLRLRMRLRLRARTTPYYAAPATVPLR